MLFLTLVAVAVVVVVVVVVVFVVDVAVVCHLILRKTSICFSGSNSFLFKGFPFVFHQYYIADMKSQ